MESGLTPEEIEAEHAQVLEERASMMIVSPGSGAGSFLGMATAADVAAEPSPVDDTYTIQEEPTQA